MSQGPFPQQQAWRTLNALLTQQLSGVDVQAISGRDFNADGDLIMTPPSVRTFYAGSKFASTSDTQRLSYESTGRFMLLCADEANTEDLAEQAFRSVGIADRVCAVLAGARLNLPSGDVSEPVTLATIDPLPVDGVGTAYGIGIEVPGLAQFSGANAAGFTAGGA